MIRIRLNQDWESHRAGDEINLPVELARATVERGVAIIVRSIGPWETKPAAPDEMKYGVPSGQVSDLETSEAKAKKRRK